MHVFYYYYKWNLSTTHNYPGENILKSGKYLLLFQPRPRYLTYKLQWYTMLHENQSFIVRTNKPGASYLIMMYIVPQWSVHFLTLEKIY
jgi:hypothetical protein